GRGSTKLPQSAEGYPEACVVRATKKSPGLFCVLTFEPCSAVISHSPDVHFASGNTPCGSSNPLPIASKHTLVTYRLARHPNALRNISVYAGLASQVLLRPFLTLSVESEDLQRQSFRVSGFVS